MRSGDDRSEKTPKTSETKKPKSGGASGAGDKAVGDALRSVYQDAVDENVPNEMLDLLRKLD